MDRWADRDATRLKSFSASAGHCKNSTMLFTSITLFLFVLVGVDAVTDKRQMTCEPKRAQLFFDDFFLVCSVCRHADAMPLSVKMAPRAQCKATSVFVRSFCFLAGPNEKPQHLTTRAAGPSGFVGRYCEVKVVCPGTPSCSNNGVCTGSTLATAKIEKSEKTL